MGKPPKREPKIKNRIRHCRKTWNLTQKELAYLLDVSEVRVSRWEKEKSLPRLYYAIGLAVACGRMVEDLFLPYYEEWREKIKEKLKLKKMKEKNRNYWRPLWNGLVIDEEGKHIEKMGKSVWLLLYFILKADDRTGFLRKNYEEISREIRVKERTIRYWLKNLKDKGYISTQRKKNELLICVRKWKSLNKYQDSVASLGKNDKILPFTSVKNDKFLPNCYQNFATLKMKKVEKILYLRGKMKEIGLGNIYDINNINNVNKYNEFNSLSLMREELLARGLAEGLDDSKNLGFYLSVARKYPEEFLREIYSYVKGIPLNKIKKSKGALFNYLIKNYEQRKKNLGY